MTTNKPQRRHHYVPEFYLKRWQLGGDRLLEFSRARKGHPEVSYRWVAPKQTGYLDKLYYLDHLPEHLRNGYEDRFFTPLDTNASRVLDRYEADNRFDPDTGQRSSVASFLLSLAFRTPEALQMIRRELVKDIFTVTEEAERAFKLRRRTDQPSTLRATLEQERDDRDLDEVTLQISTGLADSEFLRERLIRMTWGIRVMPPDAPALLTSDRPLEWKFGMDDPGFYLALPTGPKTLFWVANTPWMIDTLRRTSGPDLVRFMNEQVTRRAVSYVWGASLRQFPYVQQIMGVEPERTVPDTMIDQRRALQKQRRKEERRRRR
ncbi:DUF4238 domain-containing protein [Methylobacterium mesophilicum]